MQQMNIKIMEHAQQHAVVEHLIAKHIQLTMVQDALLKILVRAEQLVIHSHVVQKPIVLVDIGLDVQNLVAEELKIIIVIYIVIMIILVVEQ
jgi:hypothetical protein